jgi:hypothetical protein
LHLGLVCGGEDTHVRSKHATVAYSNERAIEDSEVEICVEALAERNVAAVVYVEGWFDNCTSVRLCGACMEVGRRYTDFIVSNVTDDGFQHLETFGGEDVESCCWVCGCVGKPGVVFVGEGSGFEAGFV